MSKGYRKIVVGGVEYTYKVGRTCVDIRPPEGPRMTPNYQQLTGWSWDRIERGCHKRYFSITPQDIREYIEAHE